MDSGRTRIDSLRGQRLETRRFEEEPTLVDAFAASRVGDQQRFAELPSTYEPGAPRTFMD
jgi:hypothetical protein